MIRINLLGGERQKAKRAPSTSGRPVTALCGLIVVIAAGGIGRWYWSLDEASKAVDQEIATAQTEQVQLRSLLKELTEFESRRAKLQERVRLIEELRGGQSLPVQLLDHVSRSLPDMLWLTQLQQTGEAMTIEGRSTTLFALSDFVGNLGTSSLLQRPIEIVNSQVEAASGPQGKPAPEIIRFTVRAQMAKKQPVATVKADAGAPGAAAPGGATR